MKTNKKELKKIIERWELESERLNDSSFRAKNEIEKAVYKIVANKIESIVSGLREML